MLQIDRPLNAEESADVLIYDARVCAGLGTESFGFGKGIKHGLNALSDKHFKEIVGFDYQDFHVEPLQGGQKYGILHVSLSNSDGIREIVLHFPRTPNENDEIYADFHQLKSLYELAENGLTHKGKKVFSVLNPHGVIESNLDGITVPMLITPFQADRFEVSLLNHASGMNLFRPATSVNGRFDYVNGWIGKNLLTQDRNEIRTIIDQNKHLIQATTLLWILLGRAMPLEYQISAGDWLGKVDNNGLNLNFMLSSIRGGDLEQCQTLTQYFKKLSSNLEDFIIPDDRSIDGTRNRTIYPYMVFFFPVFDPYIKFFKDGRAPEYNVNYGPLYPLDKMLADVRAMIKPSLLKEIYPVSQYQRDISEVEIASMIASNIHR